MGKYQSRKKKLIACAVIMSVQMQAVLPCYIAAAAPQAAPPVVNIAKPNESGLSHNKADAFNVGPEGLVFNNNASGGNVNTALAGQVGVNANLGGNAAKVILQEVTGTGRSNLNGMMEIAGSKADLIIANPNGITGSGFGFINVGRATLTTGTPRITADGRVEGFDVNGGKIAINGAGNMPVFDETTGTYKYVPVSKLDIYANAAEINAQLWAQDEINVVTGKNRIDYAAGTATAQPGSAGSGVSLDVGALGGMYAGRITLVGTNKGLGMNIGGNLNAQKNLSITNNGQIVFTENKYQEIDEDGNQYEAATMIHSDGAMRIDASNADIENGAMLTARENINIELGGTLTNTGKIIAGEEYEQAEKSDIFQRDSADLSIKAAQGITNTGLLDASNNLSVTAAAGDAVLGGTISALNNIDLAAKKAVDIKGSVFSANGTIAVTGAQVKYSKENLQTQNPEQVTILETDPEKPAELPPPEPPREAEDLTNPELADTAGVAGTVQQDKISDSELALVADSTADGKYKPIIDKAANGVDLVQIAEVNSNGVSRNLYSDFNIKSSGLILNNATKYTQTELGGYIDRNMFLAGKGARVILNEVTSSKASVLNGYLEVAGNSASNNIENFVYIGMSAFTQACITFTSQNVGAQNLKRVKSIFNHSMVLTTLSAMLMGFLVWFFGESLLAFYTSDPAVVEAGMLRLFWVSMFLFLNGILDVFVSSLRGMGYSSLPTIVMLVGICGVRLLWLLLIFPMHRTLTTIYLCFPLSWTITSVVLGFIWLYCYKHMIRTNGQQAQNA